MRLHLLGCNCCKAPADLFPRVSDAGFMADNAMRMVNSSLALLSCKAADDEEPEGESGGDNWRSEELLLAALLAALLFKRAKANTGEVDALLRTPNVDSHRLYDAMDKLKSVMGSVVDADAQDEIKAIFGRTINTGAIHSPNGATAKKPSDVAGTGTVMAGYNSVAQAQASLTGSTILLVNEFWNRFVDAPARLLVEKLRDNGPTMDAHDFSKVADLVDARSKGTAYWDLVAGSTTSRGYHYGYTKAARINGLTIYEFVAVIDQRTTDLCRSLNGRRFAFQDAVDAMEAAFRGTEDDPLAISDYLPWADADEDVSDRTTASLVSSGILIPPLHAYCRSTVRAVQ